MKLQSQLDDQQKEQLLKPKDLQKGKFDQHCEEVQWRGKTHVIYGTQLFLMCMHLRHTVVEFVCHSVCLQL